MIIMPSKSQRWKRRAAAPPFSQEKHLLFLSLEAQDLGFEGRFGAVDIAPYGDI